MRAGISAFGDLPHRDDRGAAIIGAAVPGLDAKLDVDERLMELLARAIAECVHGCDRRELREVPLFVGLAEPQRPGGSAALGGRLVFEIERRLGVTFQDDQSCAIASGRTAGFEALQRARKLMQAERFSRCLVCAVDSYLNAESLDWLGEHWRLKNDENSDGVIPGEAAAAVMVQAGPELSSVSPTIVKGLGFGTERATVLTEEPPFLGLGLTDAARTALLEAGIQMHQTGFRISDVTGESYGFKEQSLVLGRLLRSHREEGYAMWHCAENIGDTGAAAGVVELITAFHAFQKGYAPGAIAMCFTSGDWGKRAVALLGSNQAGTPGSRVRLAER
jgi:3-oxoacyl-[acyl-carrier-protein] synthase-1